MRHIVILGAGTAGTIMANRLSRALRAEIKAGRTLITIIDPDPVHLYQPGLLFIPFGDYRREDVVRDRASTLPEGVHYINSAIGSLDPENDTVTLVSGKIFSYDVCIIATGTRIAPEETDGMLGAGWRESVHEFYTLEGAEALAPALANFRGGRLVVNIVEMPIKCPVAPLEFAFLADAYFTKRGVRHNVEITYVTPLDGAFTKPACTKSLTHLLEEKGIRLETEFNAGRVDGERKELVSWDERTVPFDLLVTIPAHKGAEFIGEVEGLGDAMHFVLTDARTLQSELKPNIFAIGDATNVPASKAGSVAHFEAEVLEENVLRFLAGQAPEPLFDGHANCFIETGHEKALLIDFNYETEPLPGYFPFAWGPMPLLKESRLNHLGKLAFRHVYWNALLPGHDFPGIPAQMKRTGKQFPTEPIAL
jgi:sulfide:quinone oxidoreductase